MKTIISASRRTDIPAFYLNWFKQAIKAGGVKVKNPLYRHKSIQVDLRPENVEWIVFWSRNFKYFLKERLFFSDYQLFFHFTIISHHPILEKKTIAQSMAINQMERLVRCYGAERIIWRYDPIVIWMDSGRIMTNYNKNNFQFLCKEFAGLGLKKCYFSYVSDYQKFINRFQKKYSQLKILTAQQGLFNDIHNEMSEIAIQNGITLYTCCNDMLIGKNTDKGCCVSGILLNELIGKKTVSEARAPTRKDCGCTRSIDIGDYLEQPCYFGCIYCYANPVWE